MSNIPLGSFSFEALSIQLNSLPLWVKQVLYANLKADLEKTLSRKTLETFTPEHTLQSWKPEITRQGIVELEKPSGRQPQAVLRILHMAKQQKDVMSMTLSNHWTLEQCSKILNHAIQQQMLNAPRSMIINGTINYLAGAIRLGEYLVQINRLSITQLDQALHTQQAIEEAMGERTGIADVLINLGYVKKEDSEGILFLQQESKKNFSWSMITSEQSQNQAGHLPQNIRINPKPTPNPKL
jgi:hypothetical protein